MRLLDQWLNGLPPTHRILDLGCGPGSLRVQLDGFKVIGVDIDPKTMVANALPKACAQSNRLPFGPAIFDLVICHHTMEHFEDIPATIGEIDRVLKPGGRLFVTVPDGRSFSDRLYRFLLCGGGHLQRFGFVSLASQIEAGTGLHLQCSKELFTSFIYMDKRNFVPAPFGALPGPLPRRMRWLGHLPGWSFRCARTGLNVLSRILDRWFSTNLSRYGWAMAFAPEEIILQNEPTGTNVCMTCGAGFDQPPEQRIGRFRYRCPYCFTANILFPSAAK